MEDEGMEEDLEYDNIVVIFVPFLIFEHNIESFLFFWGKKCFM